jgi:FkbM family methyltransferase
MNLTLGQKIVTKLRSLRVVAQSKLDQIDLRPFERVTTPDSFPDLCFYSPTRSLRTEMRHGPDREPETRSWIDTIPHGSILWDVGANVGSFSVYAAKRGLRVVAVEPMPHNVLLLTRNIALNDVADLCEVLPTALTQFDGPATMRFSSLEFGSAGHGFGTHDFFRGGLRQEAILRFRLAGLSMATAISEMKLPPPSHLKVDVDGIDDLVIYGAGQFLNGVQGICCETKLPPGRVEALVDFLSSDGLVVSHQSHRNTFFVRR